MTTFLRSMAPAAPRRFRAAPPPPARRVVFDLQGLTVAVDGRTHDFAPLVVAQHVIPEYKGKDGRRVAARTVPAKIEPHFDTVSRAFAFAESAAERLGVKSFVVGMPEPSRNTLAHREARAAKAQVEGDQ